jgi:hypothetical protein
MEIKKGRYKHYKGKLYDVIGIAKNSETLEDYVIYKPLYKSELGNEFWIRPLSMFIEEFEVNGKKVKRFEFVE